MRRLSLPVVLAVSLVLVIVYAEDTGRVAATLKDEASQCRYLLKLCAVERKHRPCLEKTTAELERLRKEAHKARATKLTAAQAQSLEKQLNERIAQNQVCMKFVMDSLEDRHEAAIVIRAKHETMPSCFQECSDIMDLNAYR